MYVWCINVDAVETLEAYHSCRMEIDFLRCVCTLSYRSAIEVAC